MLFFSLAYSDERDPEEPLFAGTLLADYPENTPPGALSVEPYVFLTRQYGAYNRHWKVDKHPNLDLCQLYLSLETGITDFLDINLIVGGSYNHSQHRHAYTYADTDLLLGFQILRMQKESWVPDFRVTLGESFPTGKWNHLDPTLVNQSGTGAYITTVTLISEKIFYWIPHHPIDINMSVSYGIASLVKVRGFNTYGGGPGTKGKVKPGGQLVINAALEYSLTKNWALGTDIHYEHINKSTFSGKTGSLKAGLPSSERFSLAPCIEYSWNENLSAALGYWFAVAGRNSAAFRSLGFDVTYYFKF
jgi:hypothetical protein